MVLRLSTVQVKTHSSSCIYNLKFIIYFNLKILRDVMKIPVKNSLTPRMVKFYY